MRGWRDLVALVAGLLFAVGLGIGGMTDPANVLAFLDVTGDWDPALAAVMGGAIGLHLVPLWWTLRRGHAVLDRIHLPRPATVDARLVGGSVMFGLGWGLSGLCPGPAVVAVGGGVGEVWWFVVPMLGAMALFGGLGLRGVDHTATPATPRVAGPAGVADGEAPACG